MEIPRPTIFAGLSVNQKTNQIISDYQGECFALTDGREPHAEVAAKLAVETAIWGYKVVRLRRFYWGDKRNLLRRIFRSTNIAVWQKRREPGFSEGLAASLAMVITGPVKFWWANIGDTAIYLYRSGKLTQLTKPDLSKSGKLTKAIGVERYGLVPVAKGESWLTNDTILLASASLINLIKENEISEILQKAGQTQNQLEAAVNNFIGLAKSRDASNNFTAVIVKRVELDSLVIS